MLKFLAFFSCKSSTKDSQPLASQKFSIQSSRGIEDEDTETQLNIEQILIMPEEQRREYQKLFLKRYESQQSNLYYIDRKWMVYYEQYLKGELSEMPLVDNTQLMSGHHLKDNMKENTDFNLVPAPIWLMFMRLYGGGPEIRYQPHKTSILPLGLTNRRYSCFINSGLQFILSIDQFVQYFRHKLYESVKHPCRKERKSYCNLTYSLIRSLQSGESDIEFFKKPIYEKFDQDQQHDCQEFIRYFLSELQDELNPDVMTKENVPPNSQQAFYWYSQLHTSIVDKLFAGIIRTVVTCQKCSNRSLTYDPFLELPIEIQKDCLQGCLNSYFSEEILEAKIDCTQCGIRTKAKRRQEITKAPPYLMITLKRFQSLNKKNTRKIKYPINLRLSKYCQNSSQRYHLLAVVAHDGTLQKGHYYCLARRSNTWYKLNDDQVDQQSSDEIRDHCAYMLLYQKE